MTEQINKMAEIWWNWMWPMFWQVCVLIVLIAAVDWVIRKRAWPQVRYALWLLVLVKLVLPPTFSLSTSVTSPLQSLVQRSVMRQSDINDGATVPNFEHDLTVAKPLADASTEPAIISQGTEEAGAIGPGDEAAAITTAVGAMKPSWQIYVMLVWLTGAVLLAAWLMVRFQQLRSCHRGSGDEANLPRWAEQLTADIAKKLNLKRLPQVVLSQSAVCPAVFGVFRPVLLLPKEDMTQASRKDTEHILLHELAHIKRGDLWLHGIYMVLQIIYWFNPLLWLVRRQLQHLRELCCDATVARILREKTTDYRETILQTAKWLLNKPKLSGIGILGLVEGPGRLLVRLHWLEKQTWRYQKMKNLTVITVVILMITFVLPMAKAEKSEKADTPTTKDVITDPNTGLRFHKLESLVGEKDTAYYSSSNTSNATSAVLSPNHRFSLCGTQVIPVEGGEPFSLVDFPGYRSSWSPDGRNIAFSRVTDESIWIVPVSLETAKPTGPAKKLIEGDDCTGGVRTWSPDSQAFAYHSSDGHLWTFSLEDGSKREITDKSVYRSSWSPDGKWIACCSYDERSELWICLVPSAGGPLRKLCRSKEKGPIRRGWSPDSKWFLYQRKRSLHSHGLRDTHHASRATL